MTLYGVPLFCNYNMLLLKNMNFLQDHIMQKTTYQNNKFLNKFYLYKLTTYNINIYVAAEPKIKPTKKLIPIFLCLISFDSFSSLLPIDVMF